MKILSTTIIVVLLLPIISVAQQLQPLKYNNPGLVVDLGVGLWAWPVPCDADGDGDYDLLVACPDKPSNGVWFFENTSGPTSANKFPVFKPAKRISHAVHYVMPSYIDGELRVLTPGFEHTDFIKSGLTQRSKLSIESKFYKTVGPQTKGPKVRHNQWRYVDYDGDAHLDLVVGIEDWSYYGWDDAWDSNGKWTNDRLHGFVLLFRNEGTTDAPTYAEPRKLMTTSGLIDTYGCPSPNFVDFDKDGDLDLLCGEFLDGFTYFQNTGTRTAPIYADGTRLNQENGDPLTMDLQMIVPVAFDWDNDGDADLIVGDEDGRVALVENTGAHDEHNTPIFAPPKYFQQQADTLKCGALATPVGYDWDNDGDMDLLSGNTAGYIEFFENLSGPKIESPKWAAPVRLKAGGETFRIMAGPNGSIQGPAESKWGYTTLSVADWDGDKLPDILVNGIWGQVSLLTNIGTANKPQLAAAQVLQVAWSDTPTKPAWMWWNPKDNELATQWRTTPIGIDWNKDGLTDLLSLDHEGYFCLYERKRQDGKLILLPPRRVFYGDNNSITDPNHRVRNADAGPLQLNYRIAGGSGRRKVWATDWNGDGNVDLLVNSSNANLLLQVNSTDNRWTFHDTGPLVKQSIQGHTTSPTVVDFNGDGIPDYLGGAEDGRLYYQRNPRSK